MSFPHSMKAYCLASKSPIFEIAVYSLIRFSEITRLMAKTGIISIHIHKGMLDGLVKIVDIGEE